METSTGGKQVICSLCECEHHYTTSTKIYGEVIYEFCEECEKEYQNALKEIESSIAQLKVTKLKTWITKTRAVNRFYKRQIVIQFQTNEGIDES